MNILVTGANGFIGKELCTVLSDAGHHVKGAVRKSSERALNIGNIKFVNIGNIDDQTDWTEALTGIDSVVHLAGHVHVMDKKSNKQSNAYNQVNVEGTKRLASMAAAIGIRRFVFLSTIKVNGENTQNQPFSETDQARPLDPYAISKLKAEQALFEISKDTDLEVAIIRPGLVYGPEVKANFLKMLDLVNKNIPLPLSSIRNKRSMIYIGNLVDAIIKCIEHPCATNQVFLVNDGQDISTPYLIKMIAKVMGKKPKLIPFPPFLLNVLGKNTGKSAEVKRLTSSLLIDSSKIRALLNWSPPYSMEKGILDTVNWYLKNQKAVD